MDKEYKRILKEREKQRKQVIDLLGRGYNASKIASKLEANKFDIKYLINVLKREYEVKSVDSLIEKIRNSK